MKITINDQRKIHAIQEEFTKVYPYLKLEFFAKPHTANGATSKKIIKHESKTLAECRTQHNDGDIILTDMMNVAEVEQRFRDLFGLNVQILRKSGNMWLETTKTQSWTLIQQNKEGESLNLLK